MTASKTAFLLPDTACEVEECTALQRLLLFQGFKQYTLGDMHPSGTEFPCVKVEIANFLLLLKNYRDAGIYGGMRIYFATCLDTPGSPNVPSGLEGHLSLIIVPTFKLPNNTGEGGADDPAAFRHLYLNIPKLSDQTVVANWQNHFYNNRRPGLIANGKIVTRSAAFEETTSLWYSMGVIQGDGDTDKGMIGVIEDAMNNLPNPALTVDFACFKITEDSLKFRYYQLTLLFHIDQGKDTHDSSPINAFLGSNHVTFGMFTDTDTGLPCPPSNSCPPA